MSPEDRAGPVWHLITGEYPPQPGGVSDYSRLIAAGLAARGAVCEVWAPAGPAPADDVPGVRVRRAAGSWSADDLVGLGRALDAFPGPRRLLVQYTPAAWGRGSMNLGFCRWLVRRRHRGDEVIVMFHESAYPVRLRDKPTRYPLMVIHRAMLREALRAATRVYMSTPTMERRLRLFEPAGGPRPVRWLPVPSNVPPVRDPSAVADVKARLLRAGAGAGGDDSGRAIIGNFSTYSRDIPGLLRGVVPKVIGDHPGRVFLLIGRNGRRFADLLGRALPSLRDRIVATGGLDPDRASHHLQACDLLVMPYEDGVSCRRGTAMAGLEHGLPIVTSFGYNTEPLWAESGAVVGVRSAAEMPAAVDALLADPARRARLSRLARETYRARFAVGLTVDALMADAAAGPPGGGDRVAPG